MTDFFQAPWHRIGWQGIELTVPDEWNIAGIGGGRDEGYLRLEDAELPRVEVKWADASGFVDIDKMVDGYLQKLRKDRKVARDIQIDKKARVVSKRRMNKKGLQCFTWSAGLNGYGAAWYCPEASRTVITQITTKPEEKGPQLAERVISSIQDYAQGDWIRWASYGFDVQTPIGFKLTAHKMMAGHIQMTLKRDVLADNARSIVLQNLVTPEQLTLSRWGMANITLKKMTLHEWAEQEMGKSLKRMKPDLQPAEVNGHEAVAVTGQQLWAHQQLARIVARFADVPYADRVSGLIWHCPEANSLHVVQMLIDVGSEDLPADIAARFICHSHEDTET